MLDKRFTQQEELAVAHDNHLDPPALAAIVVVPDTYETVRCTMRHLRAQSAADRMEIVIVGLLVEGLGQMMGYLAGAGDSIDKVAKYEFHRIRHNEPADFPLDAIMP